MSLPAADDGTARTEAIGQTGLPDGATEVLGVPDNATSVISTPAGATQALPRYNDSTDTGEQPALDSASGAGRSKQAMLSRRARERQPRKEAKNSRRQWAREAQKPRESLASPSSRRRGWILGIILFLVTALVATAAWFFGMGPGSPVQIPQLSGQSAASAQQALEAGRVSSSATRVFDDEIKKGLVVGSEPEAGTTIRQKALKDAEVVPGKAKKEYDESIAAGQVVSQKPKPESKVRRGTKVSYVVSRGRAPVKVPDVTGRTEKDAKATLKDAGLEPEVSGKEFDKKVDKGIVISQEPSSGKAKRGTTVTFAVSKGPRMVEVPKVRGKQLEKAEKILKDAGFEVEINEGSFGIIFGTVATQDPSSGELPEGSTVTLGVV
ncbi:MAG: PASTA domain-containing protein, partial [Micrococcaceae bacterium]|nr:PASTA domain-containing protein [Micrococcaceae bacterium]